MEPRPLDIADLRAMARRQRRAEAMATRAREDLHRAVAAALKAGKRPRDVAAETGLADESIRRIARKNGLPPLREATVVSKAKAEAARPDA